LEIDERLGTPQDLRGAQADQELLGRVESRHSEGSRSDRLQDVGIGARAHREVVLPREAHRFLVEAVVEELGVVDLDDVDLGEQAVEAPRVGTRMEPVEGVGQVSLPPLPE
jgi:hypothetical protein